MKKRSVVQIYGLVALVAYIVITSDIYISRGVEWFLYFILIPVTASLGIMAFLNIQRERQLNEFEK